LSAPEVTNMAANKDHVGRSRAYSKNNSPVAGDLDLIFQK